MYGMVNQAVEDLVVQIGGPELWSKVVERTGHHVPVFVAMGTYDDAITYDLVQAASEVLELSPREVLEAFGEHWIRYTGAQGYGPLLSAMGTTLPQFLRNLDMMHSRIALSMPELRPPSFDCEELGEGSLLVRYWSERPGLAPMVTGLLRGLGSRFNLDVTVTLTDARAGGADHDSFLVHYEPSSGSVAEVAAGSSREAARDRA